MSQASSSIAWGDKRIETRSWSTPYRGEIAIHAAKRWTRDLAALCHEEPFRSSIRAHSKVGEYLPSGAVVAVGRLIGVRRTEDVEHHLDDREIDFGDYMPGRFAWFLADVRPLTESYPLRAMQGLFPIGDADAHAIRALAARQEARDGK